jgi:hypothetical protein
MKEPNEEKRNRLTDMTLEELKELQEMFPGEITVFNEDKGMEERFDEKFMEEESSLRYALEEWYSDEPQFIPTVTGEIKSFIHSEKEKSYKEGYAAGRESMGGLTDEDMKNLSAKK